MSALGISALAALIPAVFSWFSGFYDSIGLFINIFILFIIPAILFSIFLEKMIDKATKSVLIVYAIVGAVLMTEIADIMAAKNHIPMWLKNINNISIYDILPTIVLGMPCIIATLVITFILKAKSKNTFQAA